MDILVRHSEPQDIDAIRRIYAQPSSYANTLQLPYPSLELWQERLGRRHAHFHSLVACEGERVLGQIGVETFAAARRRHAANIGLAVCESARRKGVAGALLEAAKDLCHQWLAVRRIELETYSDNAAAIALFRWHGFVQEGIARGYAFRDGAYVDVLLMAHHRAEDEARPA